MKNPIDFWFDFTSPYSYIAAERIDALAAAHGRCVNWHPMLLGAIFKSTGGAPLTSLPLKGDYSKHDFARSARYYGLPFQMPVSFPLATISAARAFYWLNQHNAAQARAFALGIFRALFGEGRDVSSLEVVLDVAASVGADRDALTQAVATPEIKEALKQANDTALAAGVFGAPFFFIDGEPFWGADRLPQIEKWLATGGF